MPSNPFAPEIEAVLFDYGLVLTGPPHPLAWERMKTLLHASEDDLHAAYWRWRHDYDRGTLNGDRYWEKVAQDLDRQMNSNLLNQLKEADTDLWTQPNPTMIAWAAALQAAGMRTGILSNLGDAMELGILDRCHWLRGFSHLTFSHRLRMAKPEAAIYRHAAEGLGVDPEKILFIDDREENVEAARQAGMQAICYKNQASFEEEMQAAGLESLLAHATKV